MDKPLAFSEEFPHLYGCLTGIAKWTAFYAVVVPLMLFFPVVMFGFVVGFICASLLAAWETQYASKDAAAYLTALLDQPK